MEEIKCSCCGYIAYNGYNKGTFINDILMDLYEKGWEEVNENLICNRCIENES